MIISVIIPVYKCSNSIVELYDRIKSTLELVFKDFEIIFVNDASPENDWEIVKELAAKDTRVIGINFSRNFGQHYAITAGLDFAKGDWIVVMDGDLQDQPEEILKLYNKALEGFDVVLGKRTERKDTFLKKQSSKVYYSLFSYLTETKQDASVANFGIYHRKVIDAILQMKDHIKYFPTMVQWVGFNKTSINIDHAQRKQGGSSYSFYKLLKLAFDNIIAFSDKPLRIVVKVGFSVTIFSIVLALFYLYKYFVGEIEVMGFTTLIISLWFLSGIIIFTLGVIGVYLGKSFERVKDRPIYIVKEKIN